MALRFVSWAAVGLVLGACGVVSGLDQYANNDCGEGCDGGRADGSAPVDVQAVPEASDEGNDNAVDAPDVGDDAETDASDATTDAANDTSCDSGLIACDDEACVDTTS